jgi:hypothetical protein
LEFRRGSRRAQEVPGGCFGGLRRPGLRRHGKAHRLDSRRAQEVARGTLTLDARRVYKQKQYSNKKDIRHFYSLIN